MERKFQHVFNVKTARRTYYLAADTDDAMRYWVNCICNVCGLQDLSKLPPEEGESVAELALSEQGPPLQTQPSCTLKPPSAAPDRALPLLFTDFNLHPGSGVDLRDALNLPAAPSEDRTYQNNEFAQRVLSEMCPGNSSGSPVAVQRKIPVDESVGAEHDYYNDMSSVQSPRTRPENLKLGDVTMSDAGEPSPALSTSSGPYIPICECFSGSPVLRNGTAASASYENHFAPLNSLSRSHRQDVPKSPLNIGHLNLTEGAPPQSPRSGLGVAGPIAGAAVAGALDGTRSSDESESVFTDDDEASSSGSHVGGGLGALTEAQLRRLRPSDSSIENENIGWTAMQRFSKLPNEEKKCINSNEPPPRPPKRLAEVPIGPLESSSCVVEERYEIPRSHRHPQCGTMEPEVGDAQQGRRSHFYTNAAPSSLEGQVFRYDFSEGGEAGAPPPAINRNLKPKQTALQVPSKSCDQIETPPPQAGSLRTSLFLGRQSLHMAHLSHSDDKLQYLDLDHTNGQPPGRPESISRNIGSASAHNIHAAAHVVGLPPPSLATTTASIKHSMSENTSIGPAAGAGASSNSGRGIVYKTVDFVKTEAFNRTRQDAEMNRASNKDK